MRAVGLRLYNVSVDKKYRIRKVTNFIKLPWDKERKPQSREEMINVMKMIAAATKGRKKKKQTGNEQKR